MRNVIACGAAGLLAGCAVALVGPDVWRALCAAATQLADRAAAHLSPYLGEEAHGQQD